MSRIRPARNTVSVPGPVEDPAKVLERSRARVKVIGVIMLLCFLAVWSVGVVRILHPDQETQARAVKLRYAEIVRTGSRGDIVASDGSILATSVRKPRIDLDPTTFRKNLWALVEAEVKKAEGRSPERSEVELVFQARLREAAAELGDILGLEPTHVERLMRARGNYAPLVREVHPRVARKLERRGYARLGVVVDERYRRLYPQGTLAGQVLGLVDGSGRGIQGLERHFDDKLRGKEVALRRSRSIWSDQSSLPMDLEALRGVSVRITLDPVIQRATEQALVDAVARHAALGASAVVLEVESGKVLAMANAPLLDPQRFDGDFVKARNGAVMVAVEPGSVIKPFTYAMALDEGVARPDEVLKTPSPWRVYDRSIRDYHPRPSVTASEMVKYSSNIAAGQLAQRIGKERMLRGLRALGLGELTGIELSGEERGSRHPKAGMGPMELITVSYGHGLSATPLQLASAVATLGNEGVRMRPWLVEELSDSAGVIWTGGPTSVGRFVSPQAARAALGAMASVMEEGGTGRRAQVEGYRIAGKTGTAEKYVGGSYSRTRQVASFVGLAPLPAPKLALAIAVDEPTEGGRTGGAVAAPIAAEILRVALPHWGLPPDREVVEEPASPRSREPREPVVLSRTEAGWSVPDLSGRPLREVLASLQGTGMVVEVDGVGRVVDQEPRPGAPVPEGGRVRLVLQ